MWNDPIWPCLDFSVFRIPRYCHFGILARINLNGYSKKWSTSKMRHTVHSLRIGCRSLEPMIGWLSPRLPPQNSNTAEMSQEDTPRVFRHTSNWVSKSSFVVIYSSKTRQLHCQGSFPVVDCSSWCVGYCRHPKPNTRSCPVKGWEAATNSGFSAINRVGDNQPAKKKMDHFLRDEYVLTSSRKSLFI